jgi:hypothetical protein
MLQGKGDLPETIELGRNLSTIGAVNPQDIRGRHYLLSLSSIDPKCPPTPQI